MKRNFVLSDGKRVEFFPDEDAIVRGIVLPSPLSFSSEKASQYSLIFSRAMPKRRAIIKIGTSLTTVPDGRLNLPLLAQFVEEVSQLQDEGWETILVSSGAVAAGRRIMTYAPHSMIDRQALSCVGQPILMECYGDLFRGYDKYVGQCLCTSRDFNNDNGRMTMKKVLEAMLASRIVPILNENDATSDEELTFGDNDQLASHIAILVNADTFVVLSDVDGLFDKNPQEFPDAKLISEVPKVTPEIEALAGRKISAHSMGGMKSKLEAIKRVTEAGIEAFLVPGKSPEALTNALLKRKKIGTFFAAQKN